MLEVKIVKILGLEIFLILLFTGLVGCASSGIRIHSQPNQAEVQVVRKGQAPRKIGMTPLNLDLRDLPMGGSDGVQLKIIKDGYYPETLIIPRTQMQASVTAHAILTKDQKDRACSDQNTAMREVADTVAQAQKLLHQKRYQDAELMLRQMAMEYPSVSVIFDLLGNVYYVNRDFKRSYEAYRRSKEIWPNNIETNQMIRKLEQIAGDRLPASEGVP